MHTISSSKAAVVLYRCSRGNVRAWGVTPMQIRKVLLSMTSDHLPEWRRVHKPGPRGQLFRERSVPSVAELKARQNSKIREIADALATTEYHSLDVRARVLNLPRSTTWAVLNGNHKSSGLSASVINRMLSAPQLPPCVRAKIIEYVEEKAEGRYGHNQTRLRKFNYLLSQPTDRTKNPD